MGLQNLATLSLFGAVRVETSVFRSSVVKSGKVSAPSITGFWKGPKFYDPIDTPRWIDASFTRPRSKNEPSKED